MMQMHDKGQDSPLVLIVDDDQAMREAVGELMLSIGMDAVGFGSNRVNRLRLHLCTYGCDRFVSVKLVADTPFMTIRPWATMHYLSTQWGRWTPYVGHHENLSRPVMVPFCVQE